MAWLSSCSARKKANYGVVGRSASSSGAPQSSPTPPRLLRRLVRLGLLPPVRPLLLDRRPPLPVSPTGAFWQCAGVLLLLFPSWLVCHVVLSSARFARSRSALLCPRPLVRLWRCALAAFRRRLRCCSRRFLRRFRCLAFAGWLVSLPAVPVVGASPVFRSSAAAAFLVGACPLFFIAQTLHSKRITGATSAQKRLNSKPTSKRPTRICGLRIPRGSTRSALAARRRRAVAAPASRLCPVRRNPRRLASSHIKFGV